MKNIQALFSAAVCGLVFGFTGVASAQDIKQGVATVVRVRGEASYSLESGPNAKWIPLVAGKILHAGATIKTQPDGLVDVVLGKQVDMPQASPVPERISLAPDSPVRGMVNYKPSAEQNVVRLSGGTTLKIDTLTVSSTGVDTVSDTELDLQAGRIFASVKKLSGESKYFVKTPTGIAAVRGTLFGLGADNWVGVVKNSVLLSYTGADGLPKTVVVGAGNQFNPSNGETGPLPADLLGVLQQIATALDTAYLQVVSFAFNGAQSFVSPTTGKTGNGNDQSVSEIPGGGEPSLTIEANRSSGSGNVGSGALPPLPLTLITPVAVIP
jgi:FecR protein